MKQIEITPQGVAWLKENGWDGHTIWKTVPFRDLGLDADDEKRLTRTFKSDPKSSIFKDGEAVPKVTGVYGLSVVQRVADKLGVGDAGNMFFGRGRRARALTEAILEKV
jgi:hypothetical protein